VRNAHHQQPASNGTRTKKPKQHSRLQAQPIASPTTTLVNLLHPSHVTPLNHGLTLPPCPGAGHACTDRTHPQCHPLLKLRSHCHQHAHPALCQGLALHKLSPRQPPGLTNLGRPTARFFRSSYAAIGQGASDAATRVESGTWRHCTPLRLFDRATTPPGNHRIAMTGSGSC